MPKRNVIVIVVVVVLVLGSLGWYYLGGPMPPFGPWRYVASANSNRYHDPSCVWSGQITSRVFFSSKASAEAKDYQPCPTCLEGDR